MESGNGFDIGPMSRYCKICGHNEKIKHDDPEKYEMVRMDRACKANCQGSA